MRKWTKNKSSVVGLALASTVALTLGTVLPLTLKPGGTSHNSEANNSRSELINALEPTTSYDVGTVLRLELSPVSKINYSNYTFDWYLGTNPDNARLYQSTTGPWVEFTGLTENFNDAYVYCVLVPTNSGNEANFYGPKNSKSSSENVTYYAQTQLKLDHAFTLKDCAITVANSSLNNKVVYNNDVALVPHNTGLTLDATVTTDASYSQFVTYQWYCNDQKMVNQTSSVLNVAADELITGNKYMCEAKLVAGSTSSGIVQSNTITVNLLTSTSLQSYQPTVMVDGSLQSKPDINAGSKVEVSARFTLGLDEVTSNNPNYKVTYQWLKDGKVYQPENNSTSLSFSSIQVEDSGSYSCKAYLEFKDGGTLTCTSPAAVISAVAPGVISVSKNLMDTTIMNGQSINLNIIAALKDNDNLLDFTWYYQAPNGEWTQIQGYDSDSLNLTPEKAYEANGYKFKCQVSAPSEANVTSVMSDIMTLTVTNPTFSTKLTTTPMNSTNLPYGSDLTLSTTVSNVKPNVPGTTVQFGYQWMVSSDNKSWSPLESQTKSTLELQDLSEANNGKYYKCIVYPSNVVSSTQQSLMKETNVIQVTIQNFAIKVTANFANSNSNGSQQPLTNNLGDNFSINTSIELSNYQTLPENYSYTYTWQTTVNPQPTATDWTEVKGMSSGNPNNCTSNNAGRHFYRCVVGIINNKNPGQVLATAFSNTLEINTYPKLQLSPSNQTVVIPHNATQTLEPNIGIITTLNPSLALFSKPEGFVGASDTIEQELQACGATYQWTKNGVDITPNDLNNFPYIINNSCHTRTLIINSSYESQTDKCVGQYNLIVTINGTKYQLSEPITVTEANPTFAVTATASAYLSGNSINLVANVNPISDPKVRDSGSSSPNYKYSWYILFNTDEILGINPVPTAANNYTYQLPVGQKPQDLATSKFLCQVVNTDTQETEYSEWVTLQTNNPVYCEISGNNNVMQGETITLTASSSIEGQPVTDTNQSQVSYQWEYYNPTSYSWTPVEPTNKSSSAASGNVTITNESGKSILTLENPTMDYSQIVFRCTSTYGEYSSSANSEVLVSLPSSTISLEQIHKGMFNLQEALGTQETMQWFVQNMNVQPNSPYATANDTLKQFIYEYLGYGNPEIQKTLFANQNIYITQKIWGLNFMYITIPLAPGYQWNIQNGSSINTGSVSTNIQKNLLTFMISPSLIVSDAFVQLSSSYRVTNDQQSSQLNINPSSESNTLTGKVDITFNKPNITNELQDVIWYACYKPWSPAHMYNETLIELTPGQATGNIAKLFGNNANIQIETNANSSSIEISGISGAQFSNLPYQSGLFLYAVTAAQNQLYKSLEWNYNGDYTGYSKSGMQITFNNSGSNSNSSTVFFKNQN